MSVAVIGASGKVGQLLVPALVAAGSEVTGVVRRPEAAEAVTAAGGRPVLIDLEDAGADLAGALEGADVVVWVAGANVATGQDHSDRVDRDANLRAIQAAQGAGVARWVQVSSLYADRIDAAPPVLQPFLRNKAVADDALTRSAMDWTIVRAAGITDGEATGQFAAATSGMGYAQIIRADLAAALADIATQSLAPRRAFDLSNGDSPLSDALAALDA
jgi:uncharacterized protein YbjT (DUF2867 family)